MSDYDRYANPRVGAGYARSGAAVDQGLRHIGARVNQDRNECLVVDRTVRFPRKYEATTGQVLAGRRKQRQQVFRGNRFTDSGLEKRRGKNADTTATSSTGSLTR